MFNKSKLFLLLASVTMISASAFAEQQDLETLVKKGSLGIYHHALKPIPGWIKKSAKGAKEGTIYVEAKLDEAGKNVGTAFYKTGKTVTTKVIDPVAEAAVRTAIAAVKIPTYDITVEMILVPTAKGLAAAAKSDVVDGVKASIDSAGEGADYLNSDLKADRKTAEKDTKAVYEATAVPAYKGATSAGAAVYHGTIKVLCGDQGCSAEPGDSSGN